MQMVTAWKAFASLTDCCSDQAIVVICTVGRDILLMTEFSGVHV